MTLAEKIEAEMNIDNPKPLTEEEKQRIKHFNETDTEKEFWNLPYNEKPSSPSEYKKNSIQQENPKAPKTAREERAYTAGYKGKQFLAHTEREKTFYINGKLHRENNMPYNPTIGANTEIRNTRPDKLYTATSNLTLTLEEAKAGKTAEQKINEFWEAVLNDNPF